MGTSFPIAFLLALACNEAGAQEEVERLELKIESARGREKVELVAQLLEVAREEGLEVVPEHSADALRWIETHPDSALELEIRMDLSWLASSQGDTDAGLEHAHRARALAESLDDSESVAFADYHLAVAHWYRAEADEVFAAAERARDVQAALGEDEALAKTLTLLGAVHRSRSDYDDALECHLEALEIAVRIQNAKAVARSRNNIGLIYWEIDEHEKARDYIEQAVATYRSLGMDGKLAAALNNLGLIFTELGRPDRALPMLQEGLAIHDRLDQVRSKAKILGSLAYAHDQLGSSRVALEHYERAFELRAELGDDWGVARSLAAIAEIHGRAERHERALEYYRRARDPAQRAGARAELSSILEGTADSLEALGRYDEALFALRQHIEVVRDLDLEETARHIAELEARVNERQRELELERQRTRQLVLALASGLSLIGIILLGFLFRGRARALKDLRRSYAELRSVTSRLSESEQRFRSVFDDVDEPKLLIDLESSRVIDANPAAVQLCGRAPETLRSIDVAELEPAWLSRALAGLQRVDTTRVEDWTDDAGARRHAEIRSTPFSLAGASCAVVSLRDVTDLRRAEEDRIRVDKLESLGLLAGGIAHDFNNAMTAVLGHVSLARHDAGGTEIDSLLAEAEAGIDHATHLTSQLLAFARGGAPQRKLHDLRALLWDAVNFGLSGSNVRVEFDLEPGLWAAELDGGQFEQVINNLVINASHAMAGGGRLAVSARNVNVDAELSPHAAPGRYVRIDLEDDGPGIPADIQSKVLDPYFTTKDSGSGLGLSTAFAVVTRHNGWMEFESVEGEGTTFTLFFPASIESIPERTEDPELSLEGSGSILVMDDDPLVQTVFRAALTELGYEVELVGDGEEALASWFRAKESGGPFDAVIMDLTIPGGMGGKAAMDELRRRDPDAVGIVVSGYSKDPVMSNYRDAGFVASLGKPFNVKSLGQLLAQVLGQRERSAVRRPERTRVDKTEA